MTRDRVLDCLKMNKGSFFSGGRLAGELGLSRTAVWKAVRQLRDEGFLIESSPKKGYRLRSEGDALSESGIRTYLRHPDLCLKVYRTIGSTNTALRQLAESGAREGTVLLAEEQTAGKGRLGRSFYSPAGSGLYMSLLLRPSFSAAEATRLTACAAVAVAEAIESLTGDRTEIKWVNDVLLNGRKVCGILTEGSIDCETGGMQYVIVGIGINVRPPADGFPEELSGIAGSIRDGQSGGEDLRSRLAASVLDRLMDYYERFPDDGCHEAYRARSAVLGRAIRILPLGADPIPATAVDIEPDYRLRVRLSDGTERLLGTGEVSIRPESELY